MPTYEYKCKTCGKEFEYMQKITDEPLTNCPEELCENEKRGMGMVERKISKNIGLVFNGSGFYLTDYAHKHHSSSNNNSSHKEEHSHSPGTNGESAKKCENCAAASTKN